MHCEELQFCNTNAKLDFTNQIMAREKKKQLYSTCER